MVIRPGGHRERVGLDEVVAVGAVHPLLHPAQQQRGQQRHREIPNHFNGRRREIHVVHADNIAVRRKELGEADDEHDGRIFDVDDIVVADLRHDVAQSLRHDDARHRLHMRHADGLCALGLAGVDGDDAAAHGLGHIRAGVDRDDEDGRRPHARELHSVVRKVRQTVVHKHGLQHHRRPAEDLNVDADEHAQQLQQKALRPRVVFRIRDRIQNAADEADQTADHRRDQRKDQRVLDAVQVHHMVLVPELYHVLTELCEFLHDSSPFRELHRVIPSKFFRIRGKN